MARIRDFETSIFTFV